jgi:hypothetical protein
MNLLYGNCVVCWRCANGWNWICLYCSLRLRYHLACGADVLLVEEGVEQYLTITLCTLQETFSHEAVFIYLARQICPFTSRDIKSKGSRVLG